MPEFTVKEVRLPELHLPEIKRDEIVRSLSGVRPPEVVLARARQTTIKVPAVNLSGSDVGRILAAAATVARLVRPAPSRSARFGRAFGRRATSPLTRIVQPRRRRSRWPLVIGGIVILALGAWAILRRPDVRRRVDAAARDARTRIDELRGADRTTVVESPELVAQTAHGGGPVGGAGASESVPSAPPVVEEPGSSI